MWALYVQMKSNIFYLSYFEIGLGLISILTALYLILGIETDPHGIAKFTGFELLAFGIIAIICGKLLHKSNSIRIFSQCAFIAISVLVYIELFTSYSGWFY